MLKKPSVKKSTRIPETLELEVVVSIEIKLILPQCACTGISGILKKIQLILNHTSYRLVKYHKKLSFDHIMAMMNLKNSMNPNRAHNLVELLKLAL